jgi:aspartyl-tRNA synthetase
MDHIHLHVQIGGGSLRIYRREFQEKMFDLIGLSPEQVSHTCKPIFDLIGLPPE